MIAFRLNLYRFAKNAPSEAKIKLVDPLVCRESAILGTLTILIKRDKMSSYGGLSTCSCSFRFVIMINSIFALKLRTEDGILCLIGFMINVYVH